MKKLRTICALACAGAMLVGAGALSACTNKNQTGVIEGDFSKEATAEELNTAISNVDMENLFTPADDATKMGFEFALNFQAKAKSGEEEMAAKADAAFKFVVEKLSETEGTVKANGNVSAEMSGNVAEAPTGKASANIYADGTNAYLDATVNGKMGENTMDESFKYSMSYENLMTMIKDLVSEIPFAAAVEEPSYGMDTTMDISMVLQMATTYGVKTYLDNSDGLKIKATANKESLTKIVTAAAGQYASLVTFGDDSVVEVYFAIDANGRFAGIAANYDVSITATIPTMAAAATQSMTVSSSGAVSLKVYTGDIELPATFEGYTEFTGFGGSSEGKKPDNQITG